MVLNDNDNDNNDNNNDNNDTNPNKPLPDPATLDGFRSKWDLLDEQTRSRLNRKKTPEGMTCTGCDTPLPTEGAFARHFHVPEAKYPNIGYCPHTERGRELMESFARGK